jgi:hypothetical protein
MYPPHAYMLLQALKAQDTENKLVLDLVTDMADVICFVFDVEQFATVPQLKGVFEEIKSPIEQTAELVAKRNARPLICAYWIGVHLLCLITSCSRSRNIASVGRSR